MSDSTTNLAKKRKNMEIGRCGLCGVETRKQLPKAKGHGNRKRWYCGCQGAIAL